MLPSSEELRKKIKKYGFYATNKNLAENGVGLIIFEENETTIKGIRLKIGDTQKFEMTRLGFENLLAYDLVTFVETLPKTVWKEYYNIYKK